MSFQQPEDTSTATATSAPPPPRAGGGSTMEAESTRKRPAEAEEHAVEEEEASPSAIKKPKHTVEEEEEQQVPASTLADVVMESADDDDDDDAHTESEHEPPSTTLSTTVSSARAAFHAQLQTGHDVDVYCVRSKQWLPAKIEAADAQRYRVHFMGWNKKSDEDIAATSVYRIAPRGEETPDGWAAIDAKQAKLRLAREKKTQAALARFEARQKALADGDPTTGRELLAREETAFVAAGETRSGRRITKRIVSEASLVVRKKPSTPAPPKKSKEELAREMQEESLCTICGEYEDEALSDVLLCDGGCLNSYHLSCLGLDEKPDDDQWLCEQCRTNEQVCFACGRNGTIGEKGGVFRCNVVSCGKFYHQHCVDAGKHFRRLGGGAKTTKPIKDEAGDDDKEPDEPEGSFRCARHVCDVCENTKKSDLMQCLKCPEAYHPHCVPPSARYNNLGLLCYRHPSDRLPRIPAQYLVDRNFDSVVVDFNLRLPVLFLPKNEPEESDPQNCHHFRLQLGLMDEVKKEPPTYRKLVRSIYTFKQVKESLEDVPECVCKVSCGEDCINRLSFTECFGPAPTDGAVPVKASERREKESNCRLGEQCGNRALHQRIYPKFERFHAVEKGWGLRVLEPVKPGQLVIEYVGEVINEEEKDRRLAEHQRLHPEDKNMYIMELSKGVYIDARHKGSVSRFINHSCDPNCRLLKWNVRGVNRIAITAIKDIAPGEELSYDYQFHTSQALEWRCYCKAKNCRGTMAPEKLNLGGNEQANTTKKLTKKELAKKMKRAMAQEKVNVRKDEKETAKRLSLTAPIGRTVGRAGPASRELAWARSTRVFLPRNAAKGFDFLRRRELMDKRIKANIAKRPTESSVKAEDSASTVSTEEETPAPESNGVRLKVVSRPQERSLKSEPMSDVEVPVGNEGSD